MKTALLSLLLFVLMSSVGAYAQVEQAPMPTPDDIPAPTVRPADPAASPASTCAPRGGPSCERCEKHAGTPTGDKDDEGMLIKLEQEWGEAVARHDVEFLERIETDDYIYTGPDGIVAHKADDLATARAALTRIESFAHHGIKVRIYGETAVVTGSTTLKGTAGDVDLSGEFRWTDVFIRRGGDWQVVASQATPISKTAPED